MELFRWNEKIISHETYFELSEESYFLGIRKPHERYLLDVIWTIIVLLSGILPPLKSYIRKQSKSMFYKTSS